jgi:hypothetical protein
MATMKTLSLLTASLLTASLLTLGFTAFADAPEKKSTPPAAAEKSEPANSETVKLRFVPEGGPWKGETPFKGASWSHLHDGLAKGTLHMHARAGIGDKFPVSHAKGPVLFEVVVVSGNDDRIAVEVHAGGNIHKLELPRDKKAEVEVGGVKYSLLFPTSSVSAAPGEKPSTNKATVFVTRPAC